MSLNVSILATTIKIVSYNNKYMSYYISINKYCEFLPKLKIIIFEQLNFIGDIK